MLGGIGVLGNVDISFKHKLQDNRRLKEGLAKYRLAMEREEKVAAVRGSGLPKDWRSRVLK